VFRAVTVKDKAWFMDTAFEGQAEFSGATFKDEALFNRATFTGWARFAGGRFEDKDEPFSEKILKADLEPATFEHWAVFDEATFEGDARFSGVTFKSIAEFGRATFQGGEAGFDRATFEGGAHFDQATFHGEATFDKAMFKDSAWFGDAKFRGGAGFSGATFQGRAGFGGAKFKGEAAFHETTFAGGAWFARADFEDETWFGKATFRDETRFIGATFQGEAGFDGATFEQSRQLGPMLVRRSLVLDDATFQQRVQIEAAAQALSCRRARFPAGVQFRLRWAKVTLDDADLAAPAILAGVPPFEDLDEGGLLASRGPDGPGGPPPSRGKEWWPWVASLRRADVAGLAIADADLQACRFNEAHNLDRLRLESPKAVTTAPRLKALATGWAWPPAWWWTRRQTLAEEHAWRAAHERGIRKADWHARDTWPDPDTISHWVPNPPPRPTRELSRLERHLTQAARDWRRPRRVRRRLALAWRIGAVRAGQERAHRRQATRARQQQAHEVANLYRALRKAREDAKDEPGAADFYYGEMEMRRHATPRFSVERAVLTLYWLVAGYALRAWRSVAALTLVLVLAAWLLVHAGFAAPKAMTFWGALRYGGRTAIGLLPKEQPALTPWGDVLQITIRVVVPVLLGLAVLSLRGRVKR
jgi:uncharacterized protein YjbI with pentapeptide repeats